MAARPTQPTLPAPQSTSQPVVAQPPPTAAQATAREQVINRGIFAALVAPNAAPPNPFVVTTTQSATPSPAPTPATTPTIATAQPPTTTPTATTPPATPPPSQPVVATTDRPPTSVASNVPPPANTPPSEVVTAQAPWGNPVTHPPTPPSTEPSAPAAVAQNTPEADEPGVGESIMNVLGAFFRPIGNAVRDAAGMLVALSLAQMQNDDVAQNMQSNPLLASLFANSQQPTPTNPATALAAMNGELPRVASSANASPLRPNSSQRA